MATNQFQITGLDRRTGGKSQQQDADGLIERATREDTNPDQLKTRESGEAREALLTLVRQTFAKLAKAALVDGPEEDGEPQAEVQAEDPRLAPLKAQYEALSAADRTCSKGVIAWEQVVAAIPNMNEFLEGVSSLSDPEVYWIDEDGQLVVGDGCAEPAVETLRLSYYQSRAAATKVKNRGLITLDEYRRKNKGQFDVAKWIWVESGKNPPDFILNAAWRNEEVRTFPIPAYVRDGDVGSRRVLRVKLNLGS